MDPGPPLRTEPAFLNADFMSLNWVGMLLDLRALEGVIPIPYPVSVVVVSVLAPTVARFILLEEFWFLPVGGAPSEVRLLGPLDEERLRKFPMPEEIP